MRETIESIARRWWTGDNSQHTYILNAEDRRKRDAQFRQMDADSAKRIHDLFLERQKAPIKCNICTQKNGNDVFFEGLSWYHCPKCNEHGYASIRGENECTSCANMRIHGHN